MMKVIVMGGLGQVGSALAGILEDHRCRVYILDKKEDFRPPKGNVEFLHVTVPWHDKFVETVKRVKHEYQPKWIIVHSTVPVGTTRKIGYNAIHSPVRGQHDDLEHGLQRFMKYVAGVTEEGTKAAYTHLKTAGIPAEKWTSPEETELNKLLCLSRYLNDLAFYETAFRISKKFKVSPARMIQWTYSYNDGYANSKYTRPEFTFPMGVVGGHCVMPVSKILANQTQDAWLRRNIKLFTSHP
jgi:hypothetical protein